MMTVKDASIKFSIPKQTLLHWIKEGSLPAKRMGQQWMVKESDLYGRRPKFENLYSKLSAAEVRRISFEIARFRQTLEMSQKDFGKLFGVHYMRISRAELGYTLTSDLYLAIWREKRKRGYCD